MAFRTGTTNNNSGKRTKNFSKEEDIALCKAWIHISEDPHLQNNKAGFWDRILDQFDILMNENSNKRSLDSISSRWQKIMQDSSKFWASHLNRNLRANCSKAAHDIYFKFDHCYRVLIESSKWIDIVNARSGTIEEEVSVSPMASHTQGDDDTPNPIPPDVLLNIRDGEDRSHRPGRGRKAGKERRRQSSSSNSEVNSVHDFSIYLSKANETLAEDLAIKKAQKQRKWESMEIERQQRREEKKVREESRIMMVDPDMITDPIRKAYFVNLQREIFNRSLQVPRK